MKIAFFYSTDDFVTKDKPMKNFGAVPFGISYLSSVMKREGHTTKLLILTPETDFNEAIQDFIIDFQPDLYCMTAVASQFYFISQAAAIVKKLDANKSIILGGHHASLCSDVCINDPSFDAICISEGETALTRYVRAIEKKEFPTGIENLWIKRQDGTIEKNEQRSFNVELDLIPFPDREMWDPYVMSPELRPSVLISRGCPFKCTYCANHAMAELADGKYTRYRSPAAIVEEIKMLRERYPDITEIYLEAETFGADLKMTYVICDALEALNKTLEKPIKFGANFTLIKKISENIELLERLQRANFNLINVGLESGSERLRNEYLARPKYLNKDVIGFVQKAKGYGIDVIFFVLMGLPTETLEEYYETVQVCRAAQPYDIYLSIFYPYPGTRLFTVAKDMGLIEKEQRYGYERSRPNLELVGFPSKKLIHEYVWFYYKVYSGHRPFLRVMAKVLRNYLMTNPRLNSIFNKISNQKGFMKIKQKFRFTRVDANVHIGGSRKRLDSALG